MTRAYQTQGQAAPTTTSRAGGQFRYARASPYLRSHRCLEAGSMLLPWTRRAPRIAATATPAPQTLSSRQHPRQPEPRHVAVVDEARDSGNAVTLEGQHDHPVCAEHRGL